MSDNIVPETLLALAKDERYVRQCDSLLKEILPSSPNGLAWLLYSMIVVRRTKTTLGMEFCGLANNNTNKNNKDRLWMVMALSATVSMVIDMQLGTRRDNSSTTSSSSETLRGRARQQFYQEQRRAMLQRGANNNLTTPTFASSPTEQEQSSNNNSTITDGSGNRFQTLLRKIKKLLKTTLLELASSTVTEEGPHRLPTTTTTAVAATGTTLSKWMIRLVMIHFLFKGNFPIWNMLGIRLESNRNNLLANRPHLQRLIALLLLQQAVASGVQTVAQGLTKLWVQRRRQRQETPVDNNNNNNKPNPLVVASSYSNDNLSCGICKLPRISPAISSNCGHVFCWKCLYQWTSTVRHECPLCRAACRPQEIMALYQYRP